MQIPPVNAATQTVQAQSSVSTTPKKEFKPGSFMYDVVNIKNKPIQQQVGIGILTLGTAIIGFRSAKSIVPKIVYALLNGALGFAAGIGLADAADKLWKEKKAAKTENPEKEAAAPTPEKTEIKTEEKVEKPEENKN